jgi:hypothetical protein
MARVAAVGQAEIMKDNLDNPAPAIAAVSIQPGVCIVIQHSDRAEILNPLPPKQPAMIDVTPIEEPRRPYQHEP